MFSLSFHAELVSQFQSLFFIFYYQFVSGRESSRSVRVENLKEIEKLLEVVVWLAHEISVSFWWFY